MANQDFDTAVVNPLERPASEDIDRAQSQLNRTLRDILTQMLAYGSGTPADGFLATAFKAVTGTGMTVNLTEGVGFQYDAGVGGAPVSIGGVAGLDDLSRYKPLLLSAAVAVPVAAVTGTNCRRDLICVSYQRQVQNAPIPVFNATYSTFTGAIRPKNMTFDLAPNGAATVVYGGTPPAGTGIAVMQGAVAPYVDEDSFLTATLATLPTGYIPVAVVNVGYGVASITADRIVDLRALLLPTGTTQVGAGITVQRGNVLVGALQKSAPAGWKVCAAVPVSATPQQAVTFYLVGGVTDFEVGGDELRLRTTGTTFTGSSIVDAGRDACLYEGWIAGVVDLTQQEIIQGTSVGWQTAGAFSVAVGQPYLMFTATFGVENLTLTSFSATKLEGSLATPPSSITLDFTTTELLGGAATTAVLGNSGSGVPNSVTSTAPTGNVRGIIDTTTLISSGNYRLSLITSLQRV
jgi:hypothetical protein